jgi:CheY-like chemotaxis protein
MGVTPSLRLTLDGLKCLDMLRASKGTEQTPVILMSAAPPQGVQSRTDLVLASEAIRDGHLTRPDQTPPV